LFTGIIDNTGIVQASPETAKEGLRLKIHAEQALDDLHIGESIAINGVCLTVEPGSVPGVLIFFASPETLRRTTLGKLKAGDAVNLERSLRADARLGGHLVAGHVDAIGAIRRWESLGESWELEIEFPEELAQFIAPQGSIAVDGISLTVVEARASRFTVAVIPHTVERTTLRTMAPGRQVNLEVDMLARYVVRALEVTRAPSDRLSLDFLRRAGFA
jgi:riboflavin synthase alpha subunit